MPSIDEREHELVYRPGYATHQTSKQLVQESCGLRSVMSAEKISQCAMGEHIHDLRVEQPTTLSAWAAAGTDYDSTLTYDDRTGFRCGSCFEYPAFDPVEGQALTLRVRPLVVMERSVIDACCLGLGTSAAAHEKLAQLKMSSQAVNGDFTTLWHNSRLITTKEKRKYARIV